MPQAPAAPTAPATPAAAYAALLIEQAKVLEKERASHQEKIASNRDQLRQMRKSGNLTSEQAKWLDVWYPDKEKGERRSAEQIEATRKAREAVRKATTTQDNGGAAA